MAGDDAARAFYAMSKHLKQLGEGDLRKQFHKEMKESARVIVPAVVAAAGQVFPARNGLAKSMARRTRYKVVAKTGASTAGVSIRANRTDPRVDTEGRVAHPIFGRKGKPKREGGRNTAVTTVPGAVGFFSRTIEQEAPRVREELAGNLERWAFNALNGGRGA